MSTKEQRRKWKAAYYQRHRESVLAKANRYYADNGEAVREKVLLRHKRKLEAAGKVYRKGVVGRPPLTDVERAARKISRREYLKKWRERNPEKHKAQTKRHYANTKDYFKTNARNRRYKLRGIVGEHTKDDIAWLRKMQKGKCAFCLKAFGRATPDIDHYVPVALGGTNDRKNLRLLHSRCNRRKQAKHPQDFGLSHGLLAW